MTEWLIVRTAQPTFSRIEKERCLHGKIYTLWQDEHACWISQSVPALVAAMNRFLPRVRHLHESGLYSVLRHETTRGYHKYFRIRMWDRADLISLNEFLAQYDEAIFITREPNCWVLAKTIKQD